MTTVEAKISTMESSPNAINANEPDCTPSAMVTTTSIAFHTLVAHSSRSPRRRSSAAVRRVVTTRFDADRLSTARRILSMRSADNHDAARCV